MPEIILVNGGRGANTILPYLVKKKNKITSIVNAYDDGKSTGEIRKHLNILGPSDIRKVHDLMLDNQDPAKEEKLIFNYRFPVMDNDEIVNEILNFITVKKKNNIFSLKLTRKYKKKIKGLLNFFLKKIKSKKNFTLSDCSLMNCIYAAAFLKKKDVNLGIREIKKIFLIKHDIFVNSSQIRHLVAIRENGKILYNEAEIVEFRSNIRIKKIFLLKKRLNHGSLDSLNQKKKYNFLKKNHKNVLLDKKLFKKIKKAKLIIFCPGTQHSSLYPTYLTTMFAKTVLENKNLKKIFITNIGTDYETPKYKASDYINYAIKYLFKYNKNIISEKDFFDLILINKPRNNKIPNYVKFDQKNLKKLSSKIICKDFEEKEYNGRHDAKKVYFCIKKFLNEKN